jgi:hypothetical protein
VQNDLKGSAHLPTPLLKFLPWLALVQLWTTQTPPVDYIYVVVDLRRFEGLNPELGSLTVELAMLRSMASQPATGLRFLQYAVLWFNCSNSRWTIIMNAVFMVCNPSEYIYILTPNHERLRIMQHKVLR